MLSFDERDVDMAAVLEADLLCWLGVLPPTFDGAMFVGTDRKLFDISQVLILKRRFLRKDGKSVGFVDIAQDDVLGSTLVHAGEDGPNEFEEAEAAFDELVVADDKTSTNLCVYSFPKIGLRIERDNTFEIIDLYSKRRVPGLEGGHSLGSWSYVDSRQNRQNALNVMMSKRVGFWSRVAGKIGLTNPPSAISKSDFGSWVKDFHITVGYKCIKVSSSGCQMAAIPIVGQSDDNLCVAASMSMALTIFKQSKAESEVAMTLGLKNGNITSILPSNGVISVKEFFEKECKLQATIKNLPKLSDFNGEFGLGPVISLINGHGRLGLGVTNVTITSGQESLSIAGLAVIDPWPKGQGRAVYWESFDAYDYVSNVSVVKGLVGSGSVA